MDTMLRMIAVDCIQIRFVIGSITAGLVMTDYLHAETVRETTEVIHVPIVVRGREIKVFPIFPSFVPTFREYCLNAVFFRKTHVPLHVPGSRSVMRSLFPGHGLDVHTPPDAHELHRFDPRGVFDLTGFVEVQHDTARH